MKNLIIGVLTIVILGIVWIALSKPPNLGAVNAADTVSDTIEKRKARGQDQRVYERYKDNYLEQITWPAEADQMVLVQPLSNTMPPFFIDAYEATIADRTAWSVKGLTPTTKLRYSEAIEACKNAGKRLCSVQEWQTACRGGQTTPVLFPNPDQLNQACDFARSKGYDEQDFVNKNDSHPACHSNGIYHMIGNVSEFTMDQRQVAVVGLTYYDAHITDKSNALRQACEIIAIPAGQYPSDRHNEGMGFRCCRNAGATR